MGKGKATQPAGQTTTTTNQAPWSVQQPYLEQAMSSAQGLYNTGGPQYYPGATYAPETQGQAQGISGLFGAATAQQPLATAGTNFSTNTLGTNPYQNSPEKSALTSYLSGAQMSDPYMQNLSNSVLAQAVPAAEAPFIQGGGLSGPNAAYAVGQGATAALGPLMFQQYQNEQQNQLNAANIAAGAYGQGTQQQLGALALSPQTMQAAEIPAQTEYNAGAQNQQLYQQQINDAIQRWNYQQTLPYQTLNQYIGQVSGNYGGTGSQSTPYYLNQGANAVSGGLGGALLGSSLIPTLTSGAVGTGAGAGIGGAAGLLLGLI